MVWVQNWPFFKFFFFCQYRPAKYVLSYSTTKKRSSWLKKQRWSENQKIKFFQRGYSMVLVQNWPFFQLSCFCQYTPAKYVLWYSRTKKRLSLLKKQRSSENQKIQIFSKGLVRGLGPKLAIFPSFFLGDKGQDNVLCDILQRKKKYSRI